MTVRSRASERKRFVKKHCAKRVLAALAAAIVLLSAAVPAYAASKIDNCEFTIVDEKEVRILRYSHKNGAFVRKGDPNYELITSRYGDEGTVVIPSLVDMMYNVTTIATGALLTSNIPNLKTVILPDTVTTIEDGAISDGVTVVRNYIANLSVYDLDPFRDSYSYVQGVVTEFTDENGIVYANDEGVLTVIGYTGESSEVRIPTSVNNCKVKSIGTGALTSAKIRAIYVPTHVSADAGALGDCKIVLNADSANPIVINEEKESGQANPVQEIDIVIPDDSKPHTAESSSESESGSESTEAESEDGESSAESESEEETDESGETVLPSTKPADGQKTEKGKLSALDITLLVVASLVFLGAVTAIALHFINSRRKNE